MKKLTPVFGILALLAGAATASAHPGGHTLTCKSAKNSGSKQAIEFELSRSNGTGWFAPSFSVTVNGKKYQFTPQDENKMYGSTTHDSPLGVIVVTAEDDTDTKNLQGWFTVMAIPSTVKTVDGDGKPVKWSLNQERDECGDSNGKATFQGVFHGTLRDELRADPNDKSVPIDTQILDCTLAYDSGMAC